MPEISNATYEFGPFRLDVGRRLLTHDGERVALTAKAFDVLMALVERPGEVVDKDQLLRRIWPDAVVEEKNLTVQIATLRKALGERPQEHRFVVTVPGRGYQFVAPLRRLSGTSAAGAESETAGGGEAVATVGARRHSSTSGWLWAVAALAIVAALLAAAGRLGLPGVGRGQPSVRSMAVLPFRSLVTDGRDAYLEIGMADVVITRLSGLQDVVVRPISAVRKYGALDQDALAAGRELKVDAVLEGHLQQAGDRVRATVRLLRVSDGAPIWADTVDERFTELFALEDSLANRLVAALSLKLTGGEKNRLARRDTESPEAFLAYLKGRHFSARWTAEGLHKATSFFEQSLAADRGYALAHSGLANTYVLLGYLGILDPRSVFPLAGQAAARALALDGELGDAHMALAKKKLFFDWDRKGALGEIQRGLASSPHDADAHNFYGAYYTVTGEFDRALAMRTRALELDPLSPLHTTAMGWTFFYQHRYAEAIEWYRKAIELDPSFVLAHNELGQSAYLFGREAEAVEYWLRARALSGAPPQGLDELRQAFRASGTRGFWAKELERAAARPGSAPARPWRLARIYSELGDDDRTFASLERAYEERDSLMVFLKVNPIFDRLHGDPRFDDLVHRIELGGPQAPR